MVTVGLWVQAEAKPGKEEDLETLLTNGLQMVNDEAETTAWFAVRLDESTFGLFDAFKDDPGRQAHLSGKLAAELVQRADELLAGPPSIHTLDVLAAKLPE